MQIREWEVREVRHPRREADLRMLWTVIFTIMNLIAVGTVVAVIVYEVRALCKRWRSRRVSRRFQ